MGCSAQSQMKRRVLFSEKWMNDFLGKKEKKKKPKKGGWLHGNTCCMSVYIACINSYVHCMLHFIVLQDIWPYTSHSVCNNHYYDVIMGENASQITSLTIVYSTVYSGADQRKHQSSASLAFVRGIHRRPVNSPHKWPVTRKMFPFDDVIMICSYRCRSSYWHPDLLSYHHYYVLITQITGIRGSNDYPNVPKSMG